ncbi:MAG: Putative amidophosphoribosyltransferase [Sporanaerobacter sp.]|uniref:ComF family protein n=1 Tax=Sporanaerobacter sp. TaxID=2010183 RepID=UPI003A0FE7A2
MHSEKWDEGYALDVHVVQSAYIGEDEYGYPKFDTIRSEIGELVYQLKYKNEEELVYDIIKLIDPFLKKWDVIKKVDIVIPVPPSNKSRSFQPVFLIAEKIAESLNKPVVLDLLEKVDSEQIKNLTSEEKTKAISGSIVKRENFKINVNLLLVDDIYKSGTTLKEVCNVLKRDKNVDNVYVLTMTKTRG